MHWPCCIITMSPLPFLLLLLLLLSFASAAATSPASLPLHLHYRSPPPTLHSTPSSHPLRPLSHSSLLRATSLKHTPPSVSALSPHYYGGYSLPLSLGTPLRSFPFLLDTASHLSSLPCSRSFSCLHCPPVTSSPPPLYLPTSSLSSRLLPCRTPACHSLHPSHSCPSNPNPNPNSTLCPPFLLFYGSGSTSGSTGGLLMLDHLQLPGCLLPNFVFGCSLFSDRQPPAGLAAFGRGPVSLPSQLGIPSFAYCLVSHKFDDVSSIAGSLFLGGALSDDVDDLQFIPFLQNPTKSPPFSVYYYLPLRRITVNGKPVKLPARALTAGPNGNGGTILDTGTTFTYMDPPSFNAVVTMLTRAMINTRYNRSSLLESHTGLKPCFILPSTSPQVELPELAFEFVGGAEMRLPVENYFVAADARAVCLAVVTDVDGAAEHAAATGPSIVIGSFQQQNYYMVYDLARWKLGFRRQNCVRH